MSADPKVIEKIRKLLALAGDNPNEHEAASAAAKAQELMRENDLAMADVDISQDARTLGISETERTVLAKAGKPGGWKVDLYTAVGRTTDCWVFASKVTGWDSAGYMVGRKQDVELAEYLYAYLVREVERLQDAFGKTRWAELRDYARERGISTHEAERHFSALGRHPLKAKNDWTKGAVPAVTRVLYDHKAKMDGRSDADRALVISKEQDLRDFWARKYGYESWDAMQAKRANNSAGVPLSAKEQKRMERQAEAAYMRAQRKARRERENLDWSAYEAGARDGASISIRPAVR